MVHDFEKGYLGVDFSLLFARSLLAKVEHPPMFVGDMVVATQRSRSQPTQSATVLCTTSLRDFDRETGEPKQVSL